MSPIRAVPPGNPPRALRRGAGLPQITVAARANVALQTLRLYEADPGAVSESVRPRLDAVYQEIYRDLSGGKNVSR